jgi:hypothetical protein
MKDRSVAAEGRTSAGITRRQFMPGAAAGALAGAVTNLAAQAVGPAEGTSINPVAAGGVRRLRAFDYRGVRLLDSPWQRQMMQARDMYFNMNNDDMLKGYRRMAGFPTPGQDMAGWSQKSTSPTFGQWLSGYARLGCALEDKALKDKCIHLIAEWEKTIGADGDPEFTASSVGTADSFWAVAHRQSARQTTN